MTHPTSWRSDPDPYLIADGVGRFRDPADSHLPAAPSFALVNPPVGVGPLPSTFRAFPLFTTEPREGSTARVVRIPAPRGTSLYGTGEVAGPLLRNGLSTTCYNTDASDYNDTTPSLYQSHPWVLAVRPDGSSFGVLADTTCRCRIDLGHSAGADDAAELSPASPEITFTVDDPSTPPFAVYIFERDTPQEVVAALADLTGRMPLPPRWALGYHQCRWSYEPASRVRELADEFRAHKMPCDCIWLDIDYMDGFRCFTFDKTKFPDPAALNADLHARGFKAVWMIDPGIKVDHSYPVYTQGAAGDHFLKNSQGGEYHGSVWPGPCAFPDFTRESARRWWAGLYHDFMATGPDGVWNDMNEPAIFDNHRKQMPEDNHHRADPALGGPGPHSRYHNVYGMLMVRATREGVAAAQPGKRPFVLTRSNFIGGQRYAATWTGDNISSWDHLAWSIPMVLNFSLSGQPFCGPDIGGFNGNADGKLFGRWMGIGALLPFARGHTIKDSKPHEPWSFGPECESTCRYALQRRYRLLPYLYTLFRESSQTDVPIARPVFFADPADPALRDVDDCFLLGPDLLVRASVLESAASSTSPMPKGDWRPFEPCPRPDGTSDPELPELLIRAGAIIPMGPIQEFTDEKPLNPLTLIVCPDSNFSAVGDLYEDAGEGYAHLEGHFRHTTYRAHRDADHLIITKDSWGRLHKPDREIEVIVLLPGGQTLTARARIDKSLSIPLHGKV